MYSKEWGLNETNWEVIEQIIPIRGVSNHNPQMAKWGTMAMGLCHYVFFLYLFFKIKNKILSKQVRGRVWQRIRLYPPRAKRTLLIFTVFTADVGI